MVATFAVSRAGKAQVVAAAIIGVTVAVCGVVGFIGLVMPHITRLCVGGGSP